MNGPTEPVGIMRRACDRCHGQKLSCQRDGNDSSRPCTRCLRAETPCSTSLSQRNRRRRPLSSAMSTPAANSSSLKRLLGRSFDGGGDGDGHAARNPSFEGHDSGSESSPVNRDRFNDATNECLTDPSERPVCPTPSAEAMDWISFDWTNGGLNPFSVADFDSSNRATTPGTLGSFADSLYGLQDLGIITPLTSSVSATDVGDPVFGLGGETDPTPRPPSVHSTSIPASWTGPSNASGDATSAHPTQTDGKWLQRLVEINMQLFDHANKAKAKTGDSDPATESTRDNEASSSTIQRPPGFNSFDETIVLSFYLVKALHSLYNPESLKMDQNASITLGPPPILDSGTMLIIFSCYVRMLDLLMDRLGALRSALNATAAPPLTTAASLTSTTPTPSFLPSNISASNGSSPGPGLGSGPNGAALLLPTLVACGCPLEGYPVLRLRMTLELVEEVLEVTSALVTPIVHDISNESQSGQSSLTPMVSPQALSAREQTAYRIIQELRADLRRHRRIMFI